MSERNRRRIDRNTRRSQQTRREFLGLSLPVAIGGGIVLVTGGISGLYYLATNGETEIDRVLAQHRKKEEDSEPVIDKAERGFERFAAQAWEKINAVGISPQEQEVLKVPFEIARINRQNANRNINTLRRKELERTRSTASSSVMMENANYFYYDLNAHPDGAAAGFNPHQRVMTLSFAYNPDSILDNLIKMHELVHVGQDTNDRATLPAATYGAYLATTGSRTRAVDIYEASAFSEELFVLNLFTEGQFRTDVTSMQGSIDLDKYLKMLGARTNQRGAIEVLANLGARYYRGKSSLTHLDPDFISYVASAYRQQGADIYSRTPNGFVLRP